MKIRAIALSGVAILLLSSFVPTANASKTPKPITSFQDAVNRPADVSYWAWKKSSDQILSSTAKSSTLELIVGPNTKLSNPNPQLAFAIRQKHTQFITVSKMSTGPKRNTLKSSQWQLGKRQKMVVVKLMSAGVLAEPLTTKVTEFC